MGTFGGIVRGALAGLNNASGDTQTAQVLEQKNKDAQQAQHDQLRAQVLPHALAIKGLQAKLQALDPQKDAHEYAAITHDIARNLAEVRGIIYPEKDPKGNFFERGITDKLHLSSLKDRQQKQQGQQAKGKAQDESSAQAIAQGTVPYNQSAPALLEADKAKNAQTLETQRASAAQALEQSKANDKAPKVPKGFKAMEQGGMALGVEDQDTGSQYLPAQLGPKGDAPPQAKQIWSTIQSIQAGKEARLDQKDREAQERINQSQERIAHALGSQANQGTWSQAEDAQGNPVLFNSKTGETKAAPAGLHKSGYFAKQIAPLEASDLNIKGYIGGGKYTGPGDLDLQHQYFTATQPATGFRMTKVQQDILSDSQSWVNSMQGKAHHFATGTWFSDTQRKQIADEAQKAIAAKRAILQQSSAGPKANSLGDTRSQQQGGPSDDDIIKALSGKK
jgi:hypothetical protein